MSLASRAALAVVLMIGFYLLAIGIAAGLLFIPYAELKWSNGIHVKLAIACVLGALAILWSLVPRRDKFEAPGPLLAESDQPELFAFLREVARATSQEMPAEVYLIRDVNAWVMQRGGVMGFGSRRVMGIGVPLLQVLTVSQLRAVIAHEFGHYVGGDTKLGPWVYKTREAIGRTIRNLGDSVLQKPFLWYGNFFLRITEAISRAQELAADRLAATVAGAKNAANALVAVHRAAVGYDAYWTNEVMPLLSNGYRPPIADGYSRFAGETTIADALGKAVEKELSEGQGDVYDSHPPLRERVEALSKLPQGTSVESEPFAATLLRDLPKLEEQLVRELFIDPAVAAKLAPVSWEETGTKVYLPLWQERAKEHAELLRPITTDLLPDAVSSLPGLATKMKIIAIGDEQTAIAAGIIGGAFAARLHAAGWACDTAPGQPFVFSRDGRTIEPFTVIGRLRSGELTADGWAEQCRAAGIEQMPLA